VLLRGYQGRRQGLRIGARGARRRGEARADGRLRTVLFHLDNMTLELMGAGRQQHRPPAEAARCARFRSNGEIKWRGRLHPRCALSLVKLLPSRKPRTVCWQVRFFNVPIGIIDQKTRKLRRCASDRERTRSNREQGVTHPSGPFCYAIHPLDNNRVQARLRRVEEARRLVLSPPSSARRAHSRCEGIGRPN